MTSVDPHDRELAFRAVDAGALEVCAKPRAVGEDPARAKLVRLVKVLAKVPVVTRRRRVAPSAHPAPARPAPAARHAAPALRHTRVVAIGASTGGPPLLHALLHSLPAPFPVPILVTQHIASGFAEGLAEWLADVTGHRVAVCAERAFLEPGRVYLAPDERHLRLVSREEVAPVAGPPRGHLRPSVDELFDSVAAFVGRDATAVLLTGMGRDGAEGLLRLRECGAETIVQTPDSCAVDGMPRTAIELGAATWVLDPVQIAGALARIGAPARSTAPARAAAAVPAAGRALDLEERP